MGSGPRVAVILLDGTDPESIARHIEAGRMPVLAKAFSQARKVGLQSLNELFPTSLWPCLASGVAVENHGIHNFRPIRSGTLDVVEPTERQLPAPFWEIAVRAGLGATVIDAPIYGPPPPHASLDGLRYLEWGAHPAIRPAGSFPPSLISEIQLRHPAHPFRDDDSSLKSVEELTTAKVRLCEGIRAREAVILDMLDQCSSDLLVAGFAEAHIGGHQFVNLTAVNHTHYDPVVAAELGELPLRTVYEALDAAVGRILGRLPADATVLVACVGALRVSHGSSSLLDDVLRRVGLSARAPSRLDALRRMWRRLPVGLRRAGAKQLTGVFSRAKEAAFFAAFDWAATRAFALPWT